MNNWYRRLWPDTLVARTVLVLSAGMLLGQLLSAVFVLVERSLAMRGMMAGYLGDDVATAVAVLERLPAPERPAWLARLDKANYRFVLTPAPPAPSSDTALSRAMAKAVAQTLGPGRPLQTLRGPGAMEFTLATTLADGAPLQVQVRIPGLRVSPWAAAAWVLQLLVVLAAAIWALRQATRPLARLTQAAHALDPTRAAQPPAVLDEQGPAEIAQAASAFNAMSRRIQLHLDERMRILAAVSHDLQTPITRLRLRTELMEDLTLRERLQSDLGQMQSLVEEGLAYARTAQAGQEPVRRVDLDALLDTIVQDYAESGRAVTLLPGAVGVSSTRPQALRRVLCNLVDNALKFAGAAEVGAERDRTGQVVLRVLDRGPGIPPAELQAVRLPFYRLEGSRNRDTGGSGLGLAIADQLADALGATLDLQPREGGGLGAQLSLPSDMS
ncbi:MAG: HAMP domain-containing protein [Ramlibacter sp.]|nr:HAMP domain-containing protein [Ramlibacter sp.]